MLKIVLKLKYHYNKGLNLKTYTTFYEVLLAYTTKVFIAEINKSNKESFEKYTFCGNKQSE